ncbi:UNVERIFIED_ORG: uncharacterized protein YozE (UPF0346 family) [Xanthomonas campestris]|uniref:YozE family protein n=1 Tax=Xanthomonas arboricola TaxID=56448 RepID=UPI0016A06C2F
MSSRYYLHGDKNEFEKDSYFCSFCDVFTTSDHFSDHSHSGKHLQRYALSQKSLKNLSSSGHSHRPPHAENLIEIWVTEQKHTQGRFYRWLLLQKDRDDPVGDLAADVHRDSTFPMASRSLRKIRSHLSSRGACDEALQALEEAWSEFGSKGNSRTSLSLKLRFVVFRLSDYSCNICGATARDGARLEVDHKVPVAKGGTNEIGNLWALCFNCNRGKGASDL